MIRVLLDENLPRKLKWSLDADVVTVPERGWGGIKNNRLLRLAASEFDVLLTMDRGLEYQQNLKGLFSRMYDGNSYDAQPATLDPDVAAPSSKNTSFSLPHDDFSSANTC